MSLLDIIVKFFKGLFETKEKEMEITVDNTYPKMTKSVFAVMTSSESESTKERLWNEMIEHERNGETVYTIHSDSWSYTISNGQFVANPRGSKI